ncbi:MAG: transcription initiation factor IIB family protein [Promethearchaeota archaeon]
MKNPRNYIDYEEQYEDKCCENPCISIRGGNNVCIHCGLVLGSYLVESEKRAYNNEEIEKRRQNEPKWRDFGSRTILLMKKTDCNGNYLKPENKALFTRLSKIQNSLISSIERNYWVAKPQMKLLASKLNIPEYIYDAAWKIYSTAAKKKLTMGRSIQGLIAASLYIAIRVHEYTKTIEEVSDTANVPRKTVIHSIAVLLREVAPQLKLSYKPISVEQLIFKFGNELGLSIQIQKNALNLISNSLKTESSFIGKDPKGIAASAIYLAAKDARNKITQTKMAKLAKITEVTLRTRIKDFTHLINLTI